MNVTNFAARKKYKNPVIVINICDIGSDIEYLDNNVLRIGKSNIEFDDYHQIEVIDECGEKIRVSGPAGRINLSKYLTKLSENS